MVAIASEKCMQFQMHFVLVVAARVNSSKVQRTAHDYYTVLSQFGKAVHYCEHKDEAKGKSKDSK